jgi:hypothetical protein
MRLRLQISHEQGTWLMTGLPTQAAVVFADLADCIDYAKQQCKSAPAVIELFSDGRYIVSVPQALGWPQQICRTPKRRAIAEPAGGRPLASKLSRMADFLKRCNDRLRARCIAALTREPARPPRGSHSPHHGQRAQRS